MVLKGDGGEDSSLLTLWNSTTTWRYLHGKLPYGSQRWYMERLVCSLIGQRENLSPGDAHVREWVIRSTKEIKARHGRSAFSIPFCRVKLDRVRCYLLNPLFHKQESMLKFWTTWNPRLRRCTHRCSYSWTRTPIRYFGSNSYGHWLVFLS